MKLLSALIVDDEALDRELLKNLVQEYCRSIRIVGEASSAAEARHAIQKLSPDVLFLDINMPNKTGFGLLEELTERNFLTVFTTGYDAYGIQAVKAGAFDYLLKPIDVDELLALEKKAVEKLSKQPSETFRLYVNGEHRLVRIEEIIMLEAHGSYSKIVLTEDREHVLSKNIKQLLTEIRDKSLQRVHRSYLINLQHVKAYQHTGNEGVVTLSNGMKVTVSRSHKQVLKNWQA